MSIFDKIREKAQIREEELERAKEEKQKARKKSRHSVSVQLP